jgi:hypothetical protein
MLSFGSDSILIEVNKFGLKVINDQFGILTLAGQYGKPFILANIRSPFLKFRDSAEFFFPILGFYLSFFLKLLGLGNRN